MRKIAISTAVLLVGIVLSVLDGQDVGRTVCLIIFGWFLHAISMALIEGFCKAPHTASTEMEKD